MIRFASTSRMVPAYAGLQSVLLDLWTAPQASSNAEASILIASGSNEGFVNVAFRHDHGIPISARSADFAGERAVGD
jgi:hypothetical protein